MVDRQDELLVKHDGRYFAIGKLNTGLGILTKSEKFEKKGYVDFGLPSRPALFLNLARKSYMHIKGVEPTSTFKKWQNVKVPINHSLLFDYFELLMSHLVFSFTALEAFANEAVPSDYVYEKIEKKQHKTFRKPEIERTLSLDEKLHSVLPLALGVPSPKGKKLWQNYRQLKQMRDRVIHLKTVDRSPSGPEKESGGNATSSI